MCKVHCAGCGFLSLKRRDTRELVAVEETIRESWQIPADVSRQYEVYDRAPVCYVQAFYLAKEYMTQPIKAEETARIVNEDRRCDSFVKRVPGRDPKWHQDQVMLAEIQKREDERQEKERRWIENQKKDDRKAREEDKQSDREWQESQKTADRKWQSDQKADDRKWQQEQKWKDRVFAILLAVGGFILGWLFSK
jgi:hypothetical protein